MDHVTTRRCEGGIEGGRNGDNDVVLGSIYRIPVVDDAVVCLEIVREACGVYPYVQMDEAACHGCAHLLLLSFLRYGT